MLVEKHTMKERVNGQQAVLHIQLTTSHVVGPSRYTLVVHARGRYVLEANAQGTHLGDTILMKIPFS